MEGGATMPAGWQSRKTSRATSKKSQCRSRYTPTSDSYNAHLS